MDHDSNQVLVEVNVDKRHDPASLTKMMTAYVVFSELKSKHIAIDDQVTVSEKAWREPGSRMFIEVGDKVPVKALLQGMIVQSGNDASVALAEHVAGNESTFAQVMNQYARTLGMEHTHYVNATGLPDPKHYTTAHDTALLSQALMRDFPQYHSMFAEKKYTYNGIEQYNRNKLLWRDPSVDGLKTGHTEAAGYCLASSAERDNMRLISVVMGAGSEEARLSDTQALLNYGFRFFKTHLLYQAGQSLTKARVWKGALEMLPLGLTHDLFVTIPEHQYDNLKASMNVDNLLMAPVTRGEQYGKVNVQLNGQTISSEPLVALEDISEGGIWRRMTDEVLLILQ
ncbi:Serine-type D-Ala-D-Ala carboxypeptidase [Nitrococcus mobilis Nb-231]|uniref:serine-type D-Ala-D-Ala carboxypeptidase n=2 Tax=Nitrococcus mobilis TaxID=35797 RepID=A4BLW9_9GAMM|nr:Serine-type D-Ala-D-Ala carboxypeptidase [Nitrococcus mobilis Nb-231]